MMEKKCKIERCDQCPLCVLSHMGDVYICRAKGEYLADSDKIKIRIPEDCPLEDWGEDE